MNRSPLLEIIDITSVLMSVAAITMSVITLTSCGKPYHDYHNQVIKMRSYPINGGKY